ncbi:MAG: hypothetical protein ABIJ40_11415 [Bacteroidota bacterium]|nr:hypothetical protein [Patescibacteria group bacterium]MBU1935724.1 hypothetical protein [Patescibacteria group bacterium]
MQNTEELLITLRKKWDTLSQTKCTGTVAVVDLTDSTRFKALFPSPDIWVERLYSFMEIIRIVGEEILNKPYIKHLGDGVLLFSKADQTNPVKFVEFGETLAKRIELLNLGDSRYASPAFLIKFTLALDYGSDVYLFNDGDPQGIVIDRVFRISNYLMPNMIGVSSSFYEHLKDRGFGEKFTFAGKASLKGISEIWQEIYALNTIENFSAQLSLEQKKKEDLIDVWEMGKNDRPIWVVGGAIHSEEDVDVDAYSVQHGDSNALIEIIHILSKLYPDRVLEIVTSEEYLERNQSSFDNDIVSVSGPYYNLVTRRLINRMGLPINFELDPEKLNEYEDPILTLFESDGNQVEYKTDRDGLEILSDPSVFIKAKNPFATDYRFIYLVIGNQTQGTYGSALTFGISSPHLFDNYEYLKNKLSEIGQKFSGFGIITKVSMITDYVEPVELRTAEHLKMFTLPLNYEVNTVQEGPR